MRINSRIQARSLLSRGRKEEKRNRILKKTILHCALLCLLARQSRLSTSFFQFTLCACPMHRQRKNAPRPSYSSGEREHRIFPWYSADRVISFRGAYWGGRSDSTLKFLNRRTGMLFVKGNNRVELRYSNPRAPREKANPICNPRKS